MSDNSLTLPEANQRVLTALKVARAFVISTPDDYSKADAACVELLEYEKAIKTKHAEAVQTAHNAHKAACALRDKDLGQVAEVRAVYKRHMLIWRDLEEKKRLELERQANDIARKQSEDETIRAAEEADNLGDCAAANAILAQPISVPIVVVPTCVPKSQTILRQIWKYKIIDASLLPRNYLVPDEVAIGKVVRALKANHGIVGVEAYSESC